MTRLCGSWILCVAVLGALQCARADYEAEILSDTPLAYWRLDETSGAVAADRSGNGNSGTYANAPALGVAGALELETPNTAVRLNGVDESVELAFTLNPSTTSLTIELWANPDVGSSGSGAVLLQQQGSKGRALIQIDKNTGEYATYLGGSATLSGVVARTGQWTHLALVFNKGTGAAGILQWYVDGEPVGAPSPITAESENSAWVLGRHKSSSNQFWEGRLDEVAVYASALSDSRIRAHYLEATWVTPEPPAEYFVNSSHALADDGNPGTESEPFLTIGRALEEAGPNTTVSVAAGVYPETLRLQTGGTEAQPFVLQALIPGEVIINSPVPVQLSSEISGGDFVAKHVRVRGLVFQNATLRTDKAALMPASGWQIEGCKVQSSGGGILMDGRLGNVDDITIVNTVVQDCDSYGIIGRGTANGTRPGPANLLIRNSAVRRCHAAGNGQGSDAAGIHLSAATGATIEGCTVYDNGGPGIWLANGSSSFLILGNTVFAHHGREWWSGAGIQISLSGGPGPTDSVIEDNLLYSNTGPGIAFCESEGITATQNLLIDNGTGVSFRNIYIWNGGTGAFNIQSDNKLRNLTITHNQFKEWRRSALDTWDGSLLSLEDLQNRNVTIANNTYDPAPVHNGFLSIRDDIPGDPLPGKMILNSLTELQSQTAFGVGAAQEEIPLPKGVPLFRSTIPGVNSQIGDDGEAYVQTDVLSAASVGDTVVIPLQILNPLEGPDFVGAGLTLSTHRSLLIEAVDEAAALALNHSMHSHAHWQAVFLKVQVADLDPFQQRVVFDPAAGHGVRDNRIRITADRGSASEDGPESNTIRIEREGETMAALTINFSTAGTATPGTDVQDPGSTFPLSPGSTEGTFSITPIPNDLVDGTREMRIRLLDGPGYWAATGEPLSILIRDKAFDEWRGFHFNYNGAAPAIAEFGEDPDGDSKVNGLEFALHGNPLAPDASLVTVGLSPEGHLTLTYTRPKELGEFSIVHQLGMDLRAEGWSEDLVEVVPPVLDHGDTWTVTIRDKEPISQHLRRFLRVGVFPTSP